MFLTTQTRINNDFEGWVEIVTAMLEATCYYPPFSSIQEARLAQGEINETTHFSH